jgi:hypothetical protein
VIDRLLSLLAELPAADLSGFLRPQRVVKSKKKRRRESEASGAEHARRRAIAGGTDGIISVWVVKNWSRHKRWYRGGFFAPRRGVSVRFLAEEAQRVRLVSQSLHRCTHFMQCMQCVHCSAMQPNWGGCNDATCNDRMDQQDEILIDGLQAAMLLAQVMATAGAGPAIQGEAPPRADNDSQGGARLRKKDA